jgi:hypothetical protein
MFPILEYLARDLGVAWSDVAQRAGLPGAGKPESYSPYGSLQPEAESGLEVSPVHFLDHVKIHGLIPLNTFESLIHSIQLL